jgi:hypothetical protein
MKLSKVEKTKRAKRNVKPRGKAKAATTAAAKAAKLFSHWPFGSSPYSQYTAGTTIGQRTTVAAMIVAGFVKLNANPGSASLGKGTSPDVALFRKLVGSSAWSNHKRLGRWTTKGMTPVGIKHFAARIDDTEARDMVVGMVAAHLNGGKVENTKLDYRHTVD